MIGQYLNTLRVQRRLTPKTLALYELELAKLESFGRDVEKIEAHLNSVAPVTHARKLAIWRKYLDSIGDNFLKNFTAPKIRQKEMSFLSAEETSRFESYVIECLDSEDQLFMELALTLGLRLSEILQVNESLCNDGCLLILRKGQHSQRLPLTQSLIEKLRNFKGFTKSKRRYQKLIAKIAKRCGINKRVSPHTLRHSFATRAMQNGCNIVTLRDMLGHSNIAVTSRYCHSTMKDLSELLRRTNDGRK